MTIPGIGFKSAITLFSEIVDIHRFIESAWVAIRKDPVLFQSYDTLISKMKKQQAIIRIARKLLNRIRFVCLSNHPYNYGLVDIR